MMWKWIAAIAALPVGLAVIATGIGALLPREHVARGERIVGLSPDAAAARVRDVSGYPDWRSTVDRIEITGSEDGQLRFVEHSGGEAIAFALVEEEPGRRFRSTITDPDLPFGGHWIIAVDPAGAGSRVAIEEHGHVGNPLFRFVAKVVFGHHRTLNTWLDDLERSADG